MVLLILVGLPLLVRLVIYMTEKKEAEGPCADSVSTPQQHPGPVMPGPLLGMILVAIWLLLYYR